MVIGYWLLVKPYKEHGADDREQMTEGREQMTEGREEAESSRLKAAEMFELFDRSACSRRSKCFVCGGLTAVTCLCCVRCKFQAWRAAKFKLARLFEFGYVIHQLI